MDKRLYKKDWLAAGIPEGSRRCSVCKETKTYGNFHRLKRGVDGYNMVCKQCRRPVSVAQHLANPLDNRMFQRAKSRAKERGLAFNLDRSDVVIPEVCPVFNTPMVRPSLDRIDSAKGYEKDNVRVISWRANMLKNNATKEELRLLYEDACRIGTK